MSDNISFSNTPFLTGDTFDVNPKFSDTRGHLLSASNGHPIMSWAEIDNALRPQGSIIGNNVVRFTLPKVKGKDKPKARDDLIAEFHRSFPDKLIASVRLPEGRPGDGKFIDVETSPGNVASNDIAEASIRDKWVVVNKPLGPATFIGVSIPAGHHVLEIAGIPFDKAQVFVDDLNYFVKTHLSERTDTTVTVVDLWEIQEVHAEHWIYANRIAMVVKITDIEVKDTLHSVHWWPGYVLWIGDILLTLNFPNRFAYCQLCKHKRQELADGPLQRHVMSDCEFLICNRCHMQGHFSYNCKQDAVRHDRPVRPRAQPALPPCDSKLRPPIKPQPRLKVLPPLSGPLVLVAPRHSKASSLQVTLSMEWKSTAKPAMPLLMTSILACNSYAIPRIRLRQLPPPSNRCSFNNSLQKCNDNKLRYNSNNCNNSSSYNSNSSKPPSLSKAASAHSSPFGPGLTPRCQAISPITMALINIWTAASTAIANTPSTPVLHASQPRFEDIWNQTMYFSPPKHGCDIVVYMLRVSNGRAEVNTAARATDITLLPTAEEDDNVTPNSDTVPTIASWNTRGMDPTTMQRIRTNTAKYGVQAWMLQDWKPRSSVSKSLSWMLQPHERLFEGKGTAILIPNPNLTLIGPPRHSELASAICVQLHPQSKPWHLISVYLGSSIEERRLQTRARSFRADLLIDTLSASDLERTIIMGDFNEIESELDQYRANNRLSFSTWPDIMETVAPLSAIYRLLHPHRKVFSYIRVQLTTNPDEARERVANYASARLVEGRGGDFTDAVIQTASRIDHVLMHINWFAAVKDILYIYEPGASDHGLMILESTGQTIIETRSPKFWRFDLHLLHTAGLAARIARHLQDTPHELSVRAYHQHFSMVKTAIFNDIKTCFRPSPKLQSQISSLQDTLASFDLSVENADEYVDLTTQYEILRLRSFPDEGMDTLRLHSDMVFWPSKSHNPTQAPPLDAETMFAFYCELYKEPTPSNDAWYHRAFTLLRAARTNFQDAWNLHIDEEFTADEIWAAISKSAKGKGCGPHGLPTEILALGGRPLATYMAAVLNKVSVPINRETQAFGFQARGVLLYKNKPGNSKTDVAHYRPLSLLDSDARVLHSVIAKRLAPALAATMPRSQVGFLPERDGSENTIKLMILAEANAHGLLRRPGVLISQDQQKAYDMMNRDWVEMTLLEAGCPYRILCAIRALLGGSSMTFALDESFTHRIPVKKGLPQGAASSVLLYILAYQPFLDTWEATRSGVSFRFCDNDHRFSSASYADNSLFGLGSHQDLINMTKIRETFDFVSGAKLNKKETVAIPLRNGTTEGAEWIESTAAIYGQLTESDAITYLGRIIRMDGKPAKEIFDKITKTLKPAAMLLRRHINVFATAQLCHTLIFSKIAFALDAPFEHDKIQLIIRTFSASLFNDGIGKRYPWHLATLPKANGGIGLVDPITTSLTRMFTQSRDILIGRNPAVAAMIMDLLRYTMQQREGIPLSSIILAPNTGTRGMDEDFRSFSGKMLLMLSRFHLNLLKEPDWKALSGSEIAAMPFCHPCYSFCDDVMLEKHASVTANFGIATFLDLLWMPRNPPGESSQDGLLASGLRPPSFSDIRCFARDPDMVNSKITTNPDKQAAFNAFDYLKKHFESIVQSWPDIVRRRLSELIKNNPKGFETEPYRGSPWCFPHKSRFDTQFHWASLGIAGKPFSSATARNCREFLAAGIVAQPGHPDDTVCKSLDAAIRFKRRKVGETHLPADTTDPSDDPVGWEDVEPPSSAAGRWKPWRKATIWKNIWPDVHRYTVPGMARQAWFNVLHRRGTITRLLTWKPGPCPMCGLKPCDSDHIYVECHHTRELWLSCSLTLAALVNLDHPPLASLIQNAPESDFALGFPSIAALLDKRMQIRLRIWFLVNLYNITTAIRYLPKKAHFSKIPAQLEKATFSNNGIRDLMRFASQMRHGPRHLSETEFEIHWLKDNHLFHLNNNRLRLNKLALAPKPPSLEEEIMSEDDADDAATSHQPVQVPPVATTQDWARRVDRFSAKRQCRCCRRSYQTFERNTGLCAPCFEANLGTKAMDGNEVVEGGHRFVACTVCGARPSSTQRWGKGTVPCPCCKLIKTNAHLSLHYCWRCFEANTGEKVDNKRGKTLGACPNCPNTVWEPALKKRRYVPPEERLNLQLMTLDGQDNTTAGPSNTRSKQSRPPPPDTTNATIIEAPPFSANAIEDDMHHSPNTGSSGPISSRTRKGKGRATSVRKKASTLNAKKNRDSLSQPRLTKWLQDRSPLRAQSAEPECIVISSDSDNNEEG